MKLTAPIKEVGPVYKRFAFALERLNIFTLNDFLYHIPSRYEDFSLISDIGQVQPDEIVTIRGQIQDMRNEFIHKFRFIQKATIADQTGIIELVWFNQPFLTKILKKGAIISASGKISLFSHKLVIESPSYEILYNEEPTIHTGRLVPIYPETHGITSKWIRRQVYKILKESKSEIIEYIPDSLTKRLDLIGLYEAIEQIHFPKTLEHAQRARTRLSFDELFLLQLTAFSRKQQWKQKIKGHKFFIDKHKKLIEDLFEKLPFELTRAQKKAINEIIADITNPRPMNRLLEGDVGSGKTVVAAIAMYLTYLNGFQSVLMAPTEILAQQHYNTILNLLSPLGVRVELATSNVKHKVSSIKKDILVGTHSILSKHISFDKLGLVVIDEQQRFGVEQRTIIRQKGENPHLLTMTATPIPRTVALTLYGDLDLSYLDEMPMGRKIVKTWLVPLEKRQAAYAWVEKQIKETNSQAFVICPFIEESESMQTVKAATKEFEYLSKEIFPRIKLGLLHGKMKTKEKDAILLKFRNNEFDILVSTPVVEVGIDIPNATVMIIEASERFGLAQLHQLRGRVGRGEKQSYCLLFAEARSKNTYLRLKSLEKIYVGAQLAELDLKLRGPGEIYGIKQHGIMDLKVASFSDFPMIEKTRFEAEKIFPHLLKYPKLREKLKSITSVQVSPD